MGHRFRLLCVRFLFALTLALAAIAGATLPL